MYHRLCHKIHEEWRKVMKNLLHAFYYPAGFNYLAIQNPAQTWRPTWLRFCSWLIIVAFIFKKRIEIFLIISGDSPHTSTEWNKMFCLYHKPTKVNEEWWRSQITDEIMLHESCTLSVFIEPMNYMLSFWVVDLLLLSSSSSRKG